MVDNFREEGKPATSSTDESVEGRMEVLLNEAHIVFDRLIANIDAINSRISALFQIFLILVTLQIAVIGLVFNLSDFSCMDLVLSSWVAIITIVTLACFYYLLWPKKYEFPEIFKEKRFNELCASDKKSEILSDFLYHTREAYNPNFETYEMLSLGLRTSLALVLLDLVVFALFIFVYIVS